MRHRTEATIPIPHGVVFVYDPTMIVDVPSDTAAAPVLFTSNCISLWTLPEDDGASALAFTDTYERHDCKLVFHGRIATTGRKLAFNTSSCEAILEVVVGSHAPEIMIYTNDSREPSQIVCVVDPLRA